MKKKDKIENPGDPSYIKVFQEKYLSLEISEVEKLEEMWKVFDDGVEKDRRGNFG